MTLTLLSKQPSFTRVYVFVVLSVPRLLLLINSSGLHSLIFTLSTKRIFDIAANACHAKSHPLALMFLLFMHQHY